jgi:RNA polymerase sigma-70 factor (ECF subfamily)
MLTKTDEQLMLLIQNGNQQAFGILVKRYLPKAVAYCDNIVKSAADDIVQDSFLKAWEYSNSFNANKASFKTWFYTILNNNCYNYIKKHNKHIYEDYEEHKETIESNDISVEQKLINKENDHKLKKSLKHLNKREQEAITYRYINGLSNKQTALKMNSTIKAIETLLNRAKTKLKKHINK